MLSLTTITLLYSLCYCASTTSIPILNAGFETDGPLPTSTYQYGDAIISNWHNYDPSNLMDGSVGIENPTGSSGFNDPIFNHSPPEGNVCAYLEQSHNARRGDGEIGIYQQLTEVVTVDMTYTLRVYVGNIGYACWSATSTEGAECHNAAGFPGYRVQLFADNTLLAEDDDTLNPDEGKWVQSIVTVTILTGNTHIDKPLKIRLISKNLADQGKEVSFDDVRLDASPLQSPTGSPTPPPVPSTTETTTQSSPQSATQSSIATQSTTRSTSRQPTVHPSAMSLSPDDNPSNRTSQRSNSVTTASIIVAVVSALTSIPMILWVVNFYRLRKCREIRSRRPNSSLLAGALSTFGNMMVFPAAMLYLNIEDTPYIPWVGTFLQLAICLAVNAPYHIFTFRAYMVYFDIKFNEILEDRKWRLYIDPQETNYFLKYRDSWGNQRTVAMVLFIPWFLLTVGILIASALNGHKANTLSRLLMGVNSGDVFLINLYLYYIFPTFNDTWGIHHEIKLTLRIQIAQQTTYYILLMALGMDYYTMEFVYTFIGCFIGAFLFTWSLHSKVFYDFKLPIWPCFGGSAYAYDREQLAESATDPIQEGMPSSHNAARKLSLQRVLQTRHGFNEFARHLTKEFSVENLLFFVEMLQWEKALMNKPEYAALGASTWMKIKLPPNAPISRIVSRNLNEIEATERRMAKAISQLAIDIDTNKVESNKHMHYGGDRPSIEEYTQAVQLFMKYIPNGAYFALNISFKHRSELYAELLYNEGGQVTEDDMVQVLKYVREMDRQRLLHLFDSVRSETYLLLKYAFARFRESEEFAKLSRSQSIMHSTV